MYYDNIAIKNFCAGFIVMKKFYSLCKKTVCIDAESFPGDNPMWAQFEAAPCNADISIALSLWGQSTARSQNIPPPTLLTAKHSSLRKAFR